MTNTTLHPEITLIGAGIMSATLGIFLKELMPNCSINIYEGLPEIAMESSYAWNNAGTGHSAFCELNYTTENEDGSMEISKALKIASQFEVSKSFWSYLVHKNIITNPQKFIHNIPHFSFVWGNENVRFLKKRFDALTQNALFVGMEFIDNIEKLLQEIPLVMQNRKNNEPVAATKMQIGTDVNFGELTKTLISHLQTLPKVNLYVNHEVRDIKRDDNNQWYIKIKDEIETETIEITSKFVFIGAGGGSLPLLQKSDIPEAEGYGGFPVSGQWLVCTNEKIIEQHHAKVYGKASVGAPPMSVPHLDTRIIDGKKALLFGPFAGFSTKFLKHGSYFDLPTSIEFENIYPLLSAGWHNLPLTKYLIEQVSLTPEERIEALKEYLPNAVIDDWKLAQAGQRVQVIKPCEENGGKLEFGTELVCASDGSLAALLGASPGASTAVSVMIDVLKKCFAKEMQSQIWQDKLKEMIPSYGKTFATEPDLLLEIRKNNWATLQL